LELGLGLGWGGENLVLVFSLVFIVVITFQKEKSYISFKFRNFLSFKPWQHNSDEETINKYVRHNQHSSMKQFI